MALLACAAAFAMPAAASADDPPFVNWTPLLPGFPVDYRPSLEKDCLDGSDACIERTLTEMYRRFDRLYATCDHNSVFALVYIRVTEAVRKAVDAGFYEEPAFLNHEDAVFGRMYFDAYDAWERGERDKVPEAWKAAFDAGRDRTVAGIGNLLMSMSAHVNRDFPYLLANLGLVKPDGSSRKPDHDRGNEVLHPLYDDIFAEISRRWDPTIYDYQAPGTTADDGGFFQLLVEWREAVWRHAEMLVNASTPEARQAVSDYIEQYALGWTRFWEANTQDEPEARDAVCAAYQKANRERGALARAVIRKRGLRARGRGVRVRVACPAGIRVCDGTLFLDRLRRRPARRQAVTAARSRRPVLLASSALPVIEPGARVRVRLRLPRKARRALRRVRRFRVRARVQSTTPWGLEVSSERRGRLRRRR